MYICVFVCTKVISRTIFSTHSYVHTQTNPPDLKTSYVEDFEVEIWFPKLTPEYRCFSCHLSFVR